MELKTEAFQKKKSVAAIVREKVSKRKRVPKVNVEAKMRELEKLAKENAKYMKGVNLTKALIEMRYEQ